MLWIPATGFGISALLKYSTTPGAPAAPSAAVPEDAGIRRVPGHSTILLFAHPRCPCSRASIGELARILAQCREQVEASVFFYTPPSESAAWAQTDLWRSAAGIPGVRVIQDRGGETARRFGAMTSGQTFLYDANGRLLFSGGITASRGHSGDNAGRDAIVSLIQGRAPASNRTKVFGCSLHGEQI